MMCVPKVKIHFSIFRYLLSDETGQCKQSSAVCGQIEVTAEMHKSINVDADGALSNMYLLQQSSKG